MASYAENLIDYTEDDRRGYVDMTVPEGEDNADVHVEDANGGVDLTLNEDELVALILGATMALQTIRANS